MSEEFHADTITFATGREAFLALLRSLRLKPGEEIIIQGYTCVVLPNAIHSAGGVPVYVDIDRETLNLDIEVVRQSITPRTRAIVCQHTFGIPAQTLRLRSLCDEHSLALIEDCAHVIPDFLGGSETIGKYGDFVLMSFGRDKAISGITGGAIISRHSSISTALRDEQARAIPLSWWTVARYLQYPNFYAWNKLLYGMRIGKAMLLALRRMHLLLPILEDSEKKGRMSPVLHRMPNACARIALHEWKRRAQINAHRRMLTAFYLEEGLKQRWPLLAGVHSELALQKFPLFISDAQKLRETLKQKNIYLDDGWTGCVICPDTIDLDATDYCWGDDPVAEAACLQILSLPTHPTMSLHQAKQLVSILRPSLIR